MMADKRTHVITGLIVVIAVAGSATATRAAEEERLPRLFRVVIAQPGYTVGDVELRQGAPRTALKTFSGPGTTELVPLSRTGDSAQTGEAGDLSAGGRFVAFMSNGSNLVENDKNGTTDVFRRDRELGVNIRVSVSTDGVEANGGSVNPSISGNGQRVAFFSLASNLLGPGQDVNAASDVFVREVTSEGGAGTTTLVSATASGVQANGSSESPSISYDGNRVAFVSTASNLVPGDTNSRSDLFIFDMETASTERASISDTEEQSSQDVVVAAQNSVSAHGRFVVFGSRDPNLVANDANSVSDVFVRDRANGTTSRISTSLTGASLSAQSNPGAISPDARFIGFETADSGVVTGDTKGTDTFVYDRWTGKKARVSVTSDGMEKGGSSSTPTSFSRSGDYVAFHSREGLASLDANSSADVYVRHATVDPASPPEFRAVEIRPTSVTLQWGDVHTDETAYVLERSTDEFNTVDDRWMLDAGTTTYADQDLMAASRYNYRLSAQLAGGLTDYATLDVSTAGVFIPDIPEIHAGLDGCLDVTITERTLLPFEHCLREEMHYQRVYYIAVNVCLTEMSNRGSITQCTTLTLTAPESPPPLPNEDDPSEPPPFGWVPPHKPGENPWAWRGDDDAGWPTNEGSWFRDCADGVTRQYLHWDGFHESDPGPHWGFEDCRGQTWERLFRGAPNSWIPYKRP